MHFANDFNQPTCLPDELIKFPIETTIQTCSVA